MSARPRPKRYFAGRVDSGPAKPEPEAANKAVNTVFETGDEPQVVRKVDQSRFRRIDQPRAEPAIDRPVKRQALEVVASKEETQPNDESEEEDGSEEGSDGSEESDGYDEESESEEEVARPKFIPKFKRKPADPEPVLADTDASRKDAALDFIAHEQRVQDQPSEGGIDDTDGLDPDVEYAAWRQREKARMKREHDRLAAIEQELEERALAREASEQAAEQAA